LDINVQNRATAGALGGSFPRARTRAALSRQIALIYLCNRVLGEMRLKAKRGQSSSAQSPQRCGRLCIPLRGGEAVPSDGLCSVLLRNTSALLKHAAQVELSACVSLISCKTVQSRSLGIVLHNTFADLKADAQCVLSACEPLISCKAEQSYSLGIVLHNTSAEDKHDAQVELSDCMPLISCKAVQSRSLGMVLRNAATTNEVAQSNHILPEAALSLPSASPLS
jgi:hypothetical protein